MIAITSVWRLWPAAVSSMWFVEKSLLRVISASVWIEGAILVFLESVWAEEMDDDDKLPKTSR